MRESIYQDMNRVEDYHWWFAARRFIIGKTINDIVLPSNLRILEAGSGTGGNLAMLASKGTLSAFEMNATARKLANKRGIITVQEGHMPDGIPTFDHKFNLICMLDVLEHVGKDQQSLTVCHTLLEEGGCLLLTVPAFSFLWSTHDEAHHHHRRYRAGQIRQMLAEAGFNVEKLSYFNLFFFPLIATIRIADRLYRKITGKHAQVNYELMSTSSLLNNLCRKIFSFEYYLLKHISLPFGVSILAIARK